MTPTELLPGIYTVDHQVADGKNVIVFGPRGCLVIDVSLTCEEGQATADFVRAQGYEPNRVLLTHGHSDHVLGGQPFVGAEVYAPVGTPATMRRHLNRYAEVKGLDGDALLAQALWPTILFSGELLIDMGDRTLRVFPTPGHSPDSVSIYIEADRLLLASDTVATGIVPVCQDGDSRQLEASLRQLLNMNIEILVSGHGPALHGQDRIRDHLQWSISYLSGVRAAAQAAIARGERDADTIADSIAYDTHIGDRLPRERHNMPGRHRNSTLKIAREELENI